LGGEDLGVGCWGEADQHAEEKEAGSTVWHEKSLAKCSHRLMDAGNSFSFGP